VWAPIRTAKRERGAAQRRRLTHDRRPNAFFHRFFGLIAVAVIGRLEAFMYEHVLPVVAEVIRIHRGAAGSASSAGRRTPTGVLPIQV
jgi:hypothetical protein